MQNIDLSNFNIIEYPNNISLILIPKQYEKKYAYIITKYLFYNETDNFISFTKSSDETSLFVDSNFIEDLVKDNNISSNEIIVRNGFRLIQICENDTGIDHIGIVTEIASVFAQNNISILYINTFNNNFILVSDENYDKSISLLNSSNSDSINVDID